MRTRILTLFLLLVSTLSIATAEVPNIHILNQTAANLKEQHFVENEVKKWAEVFEMSDWKIQVIVAPASLLSVICPYQRGTCMGVSNYDVYNHTGLIMILQASDYTKDMRFFLRKTRNMSVKDDQRDSVLHEILHNVVENANKEYAVQKLTSLILR